MSNKNAVRVRSLALMFMGAASSAGCDYVRPSEVFVPDGDVIAIGVVLSVGWRTAYMIASHPHRPGTADAPVVEAVLTGPSGPAAFAREVAPEHCSVLITDFWHGPHVCLAATLPAPVRSGERYTLRGTTRLGRFEGVTVVPNPVTIHDPQGEVVLRPTRYYGNDIVRLTLSFESPREVGMVVASVAQAVQMVVDSAGNVSAEPSLLAYVLPREADPDQGSVDLGIWSHPDSPWRLPEARFNLRLVGLDENVGRFASYRYNHLLVKPWPHFGIVGDEGIYGYFGSASRSSAVPVIVRP